MDDESGESMELIVVVLIIISDLFLVIIDSSLQPYCMPTLR